MGAWVLENVVRKNFQKALDDAAKADQNLASLLLTTDAKARFEVVKKEARGFSKSLSIEKRNFQKYLTMKQKAD